MHVEVTRILTAWLQHDQYGVNAMLATLPRWTGFYEEDETTPINDPLPPDVDVYNDVDVKEILTTGGLRPPTMPSLVVVVDMNPKTVDIKDPNASGHEMSVAAGIGFYAEQTEVEKDIVRGDYVLRAVKKSLVRFNSPVLSKDYRKLNDYSLSRIVSIETQRVASAVPESFMLGILFADLIVLDKAP